MEHFYVVAPRLGLFSSAKNLRFYAADYLFAGVPLEGSRTLDIGGGEGTFAAFTACSGAVEAVCLEPEAAGSTSGTRRQFERLHAEIGADLPLRFVAATFQDWDPGERQFDVILLNNSINHLDEDACVRLTEDPAAQRSYLEVFAKLAAVAVPGARLIVTDCSRHNLFAALGLRNPMMPTIEWEKHQPPGVWADLLARSGFSHPRVGWHSFNRLGKVGRWALGHALGAYLTTSLFRLEMVRRSD